MADHLARRAMLRIIRDKMRGVAERVGPLHSYWDIITDIDKIIKTNADVDDETFNGFLIYYDE